MPVFQANSQNEDGASIDIAF